IDVSFDVAAFADEHNRRRARSNYISSLPTLASKAAFADSLRLGVPTLPITACPPSLTWTCAQLGHVGLPRDGDDGGSLPELNRLAATEPPQKALARLLLAACARRLATNRADRASCRCQARAQVDYRARQRGSVTGGDPP